MPILPALTWQTAATPAELQWVQSELPLCLDAAELLLLPVPAVHAVLPGHSARLQHLRLLGHISWVHNGCQGSLLLSGGLSEPQT